MRALLFNGNRLVTGDAIADAVVTYSASLSRAHRGDEVELPVFVDGVVERCRLQLLPSTPVAWVSIDARGGPLDRADHESAVELRERARRLDHEMFV